MTKKKFSTIIPKEKGIMIFPPSYVPATELAVLAKLCAIGIKIHINS